jgi:hypothetical protein
MVAAMLLMHLRVYLQVSIAVETATGSTSK